jgi:hypothetical protein
VRAGELANIAGNDIDLTETAYGLPRGTLQRIENTATDLALKMGRVRFDQEPLAGTNLSGQFHTTVMTEGAERTLDGEFKAMVEAR